MKKIFSFLMIVSCLFAFSRQAKALTYTVTVPDGTQACFIAGDMNGWSLNPSATSRMTLVAGATNQFTIDFPDAKVTDGYHYYCGPDWSYVELKDDGTAFANGENRTWSDSDVVALWAKDFALDERTVSIEALVPSAVQELYITGQFNGWSGDFANSPYKMTLVSEDADGKVFSIDGISYIDAYNMQFKFVAGPDWAYQQSNENDGVNSDGNFVYGTTDDVAYFDVKFFNDIYDPTKVGDITISATVPEGTDRVWIQGSFIGWNWDDPDALEMTKQGDGTFTYTVKNVQSFTYKLYNWPDWNHAEYGEADPTKDIPDRSAAFDPENNVINITVAGWLNEAPTAIHQIAAGFKVVPLSGQIAVSGLFSQVGIYDITGKMIQSVKASGMFTSRSLPAGIYIVRVDGISQKVILR